jgi:Uncharacterized conserved protein
MKHEWKKHERELYGVKDMPQILTVPRHNYIMLRGTGNPNRDDFSQRVGILFSLAYPLKYRFKATVTGCRLPEAFPYDDYSVYPLEGIWNTNNPDDLSDKDSFDYTVMIRQPDCITEEMFAETYETVCRKKPHPLLDQVVFGSMEDGLSIQLLHKGSFDNEPESFARMDSYAVEHGYVRSGYQHREIYLNDARKTAEGKRLTVLRYGISQI